MTLSVGVKGIDSGRHLDPVDAYRKHNVRFQMRYSAGEGNTSSASSWKLCGENEIKQILDAGSQFGANSEWYEDRCTEGRNAGEADGAADLRFWKSRGLTKGSSIYISWDADPSRVHYLSVGRYLDGYRESLHGYFELSGMYAGVEALIYFAKHHGIRNGWIPSAASWSGSNHEIEHTIAPPAKTFWDLWQPTPSQIDPAIEYLEKMIRHSRLETCIWQCGNYAYSETADVNYVIKSGDFGFMVPKSNVKPKPSPIPHPSPVKHPTPVEHKPKHHTEDKVYTVKYGDTLVSIADAHDTTWKKIFRANIGHIKNPNVIHPGDKIKLP